MGKGGRHTGRWPYWSLAILVAGHTGRWASRTDQKVGPLIGPLGLTPTTVTSKTCSQNFRARNPPPASVRFTGA